MAAGTFEQTVHVKGDPGQVTEVFQQAENREEYGHRRQHHALPPRRFPGTIPTPTSREANRGMKCLEGEGEIPLQPAEQLCQHLRGGIGPGDGQPEDHAQHGQHDWVAPDRGRSGPDPTFPCGTDAPYPNEPHLRRWSGWFDRHGHDVIRAEASAKLPGTGDQGVQMVTLRPG